MPYASEAQRRKFHQMLKEGKIDKKVVEEFDYASRGLRLPDKLAKQPKIPKVKKVRVIK